MSLKVALRLFLMLSILLWSRNGYAQSSCDPSTPSFIVDLSSNPDSVWISPNVARDGHCCSVTGSDKCIEFVLSLHPDAVGISFEWYTGAQPPGHEYQINCGTPVALGDVACISGPGPHYLTYCKPGGNSNQYAITSVAGVKADSLEVGVGCNNLLNVTGLIDSSIHWNSIFPGAPGDYNNLLTCISGCDSTMVTPTSGSPTEIHYQVLGLSNSICGGTDTLIDTAIVIIYPDFEISLSDSLIACTQTADINLGIIGGKAPYNILWSTNETSQNINVNQDGYYSVTVEDSLNCITLIDSIYVDVESIPKLDSGTVYQPSNTSPTGAIAVSSYSGLPPYAYLWNTGATTDSIGNLSPGTYSVMMTDANGCKDSASFLIMAVPIIIDSVISSYSCASGLYNFTVYVSGGVNPIQYSADNGLNYQSSNTFTNYAPGTYQIKVRDNNGTLDSTTISLTSITSIAIDSLQTQNPSCGAINGSATVFASGTAPITYQLNGGSWVTSNVFTGLGPGTYNVKARDSLGCEVSQSFSLSNEAAPVISIDALGNPSCASSDGSIEVSASGVASPFEFAIRPSGGSLSAYQSSGVFNNLPSGTYTMLVRDQNGCLDSITTTLNEVNNIVIASIQSTKPGCNQSNGSIQIFANGGSGILTYSINGGATFQTASTFSNLPAGVYTIVVKDNVGCTRSQVYPLDEPNGPQIDLIETTDATCGNDNGTIEISVSGGRPPYFYSINGGNTFGGLSIYNNLAAGVYHIVVRDADNCLARDTVEIKALPVPGFVNVDVIPAACAYIGGSLTITASGTAPILYSINGGTSYSSNNSFSPLSPGNYDVWIQDSTGCTHDTIIIIPNDNLGGIMSVTANNEICGRDNGSLIIHASGSTNNLNFSIDGGSTYQKDSIFSSLTAGTYNIVVWDSSGCSDTLPYTLNETPGPSIDAVNTQNANCGANNGTATATLSSGTPPYQYSWAGSGFSSTNSFGPAAAGTYTLLVRDANGCLSSQNFTISQTANLIWQSLTVVDATCDQNAGSISISASGGDSPYSYSINGGTSFQSSGSFSNLGAGVYQVQVVDDEGCTLDSTVSIQQFSSPSIDSTNVIPPYCGQNNGEIHVYGNGNGPLTYTLNGSLSQANGSFTGLGSGSYNISLSDSNNCSHDTSISLNAVGAPTIDSVQTTAPTCGLDNGVLQIFANLGQRPYEFSIDGLSYFVDSVFSNLPAGNYTAYVRDDSNCVFQTNVILNSIDPPILSLAASQDPSSCDANSGSFSLAVADGTAPFTYSVNGSAFTSTSVYTNQPAGNYQVIVLDDNGCRDTIDFSLSQQNALSWLSINKTDASCDQDNGTLNFTLSGGEAPYTYSFDGGLFVSTNSYTGLAAGTYAVIGQDNRGCSISFNATISQLGTPVWDSIVIQADICGRSEGAITVYGSPGPFTYGLDGIFGTDSNFTNLAGGTSYSVSIMDTNGCRLDSLVTVPQIDGPSIDSVIVINTTCDSVNGGLIIYVTGNAPPYQYAVDGGTIFQLDSIFNPIGAGTYDIVVIDSNGCRATTSITISADPPPFIDTVRLVPVHCEGNNGSATVTILSGELPYEYSIDGQVTFVSDSVFAPLNAGNYTVIIRDARGCLDSVQFTIDSIQPPVWQGPRFEDATCDLNNGAIYLTAIGGSQAYEYFIDGVSNGADSSFLNLGPGTYAMQIVDSFGCTLDTSFTLGQLGVPSWTSINVQGETCGLADGYIHLFVAGNPPFTYSLNGASQASNEFNNLSQGFYNIQVEDVNGCTIDTVIRVFTIDGPVLDSMQVDSSKCGQNNGKVTIYAVGGDAPLRYVVSGDTGTSNVIDTLAYGWHYITVIDAKDCPVLDSIFIDSIPNIKLQIDAQGLAFCNQDNGWIQLSAIGGSPPYLFQMDGNAYSNNDSITGIGYGSHTAYVLGSKGCIDSIQFQMDSIEMLYFDRFQSFDATCDLDNGLIRMGAAGGQTPFLYSIDNGTTYSTGAVFGSLPGGTYQLKIQDNLGCEIDTSITLMQLSPPSISSISVGLERCDMQNGTISVSATGNGPLLYNLDGGPWQLVSSFDSLADGSYLLTIRDTNLCEVDSLVSVGEEPGLSISLDGIGHPRCDMPNGSISVSASGGGGSPEFMIQGVAWTSNGAFTGLYAGTHRVYARDAWGCIDSMDYTLNARPSPVIDTIETVYNCGSNTYDIEITVSSFNSGLIYSVNGGSNYQASNQFAGLSPGTYNLRIQDGLGCITDSIFTLDNHPILAIDSIQFDPPACSRSDGSILVFASGKGPFVYSLDGVNYDSTGLFKPLGPGSYTVYVRDSIGCILTQGVSLSNSPAPQISIDAIQNPNCGRGDGFIEVSANGAASPFLFALDTNGSALNYLDTNRFDSLGPGSYVLWAIDTNGCESSQNIFLFEVNNMVINSIFSSSPGCGSSNGSITMTGSGGTAPLVYSVDSGATFQSSGHFPNLPQGNYHLLVQDVNGCSRYQAYSLNDPFPPQIDLIETEAKRCGFNNGEIRIFASGGSLPYDYSIDDGATFSSSSNFAGLDSGTYIVHIRDNKSCLVYDTVFVGALLPPVWDTLYSLPQACPSLLGSIHIGVSGLSPMLYSINNGASYQSDSAFFNVATGTYNVAILDSTGCRMDTTILVAYLALAEIDSIKVWPEICDKNNAAIRVYPSGDTSLLSYSIDGGLNWQDSSFFGNLDSGNYEVIVWHPNTCADTQQVFINFSIGPSLNSISTSATNCSQVNGRAVLQASSGLPPLEFALDSLNYGPDSLFIGLAVGNYTGYVRDNQGCVDTLSFKIDSIQHLAWTQISSSDALCRANDASIMMQASFGTKPYQYSIDGGISWTLDSTFTGLSDGTYLLQIQDAAACIVDSSVTVSRFNPPAFTNIETNPEICNADNGSITLRAVGTGSLSYSINGAAWLPDTVFTSLDSGFYVVSVRDSLGCETDSIIRVEYLFAPVIDSVYFQDITCLQDNGRIQIFAQGMQSPLQYSVDSGATWSGNPVFSNLSRGLYYIFVRDTNLCEVQTTQFIDTIPMPVLDSVETSIAFCGSSNGSAVIVAASGQSPYAFSIDGTNFNSSNSFSGLSPGSYWAYVRDFNFCIDSLQFSIDSIRQPNFLSAETSPTTCEQPNGSMFLHAVNGTQPYQFSIDNGVTFSADSVYTGLASGVYLIVMQDQNGCIVRDTIEVENLASPSLLVSSQDSSTCDDFNGSLTLHALGNGPFQYSIDGGTSFQTDSSFINLQAGSYNLMVVDTNGCSVVTTEDLEGDYSLPVAIKIFDPGSGCAPYTARFRLDMSVQLDSCRWDMGDGTIIYNCDAFNHEYDQVGCYNVQVYVETNRGCYDDTSFSSLSCALALPNPDFETEPFGNIERLEQIQTTNYSTNADSVNWFINGELISTEWEPIIRVVTDPNDSLAKLCLVTYSAAGCRDSVCTDLRTDVEFRWWIANAFTPNRDGKNELFKPVFYNVPIDYEFRIFDRWGEVVFSTTNPDHAWDGRYTTHPEDKPKQDVYGWRVTFTNPANGEIVDAKGQVSLLY